MEVIPAIDIRNGRCVRLYQGDYGRETVYSDLPLDVARRWVELGATRLHIVDLDGARAGAPVHLGLVAEIASSVSAAVQLGGGIRSVESAEAAVSAGADRVILGTAAVENPELVEALCSRLGVETVAVSIDARDGYVAVSGWTEGSGILASEVVDRMVALGVQRLVHTDVTRDGTLTEPNFEAVAALAAQPDLHVLAAGGISQPEHLVRLAGCNLEGAIVGKALYTGDIDLAEAIRAAAPSPKTT